MKNRIISKRFEKICQNGLIRIRMNYDEYVIESGEFSMFAVKKAKWRLKKLKKKYPYCWRTREND